MCFGGRKFASKHQQLMLSAWRRMVGISVLGLAGGRVDLAPVWPPHRLTLSGHSNSAGRLGVCPRGFARLSGRSCERCKRWLSQNYSTSARSPAPLTNDSIYLYAHKKILIKTAPLPGAPSASWPGRRRPEARLFITQLGEPVDFLRLRGASTWLAAATFGAADRLCLGPSELGARRRRAPIARQNDSRRCHLPRRRRHCGSLEPEIRRLKTASLCGPASP